MNYFRAIIFVIILSLPNLIEATDQSEIVEIRGQGRGATKAEAIQNAKLDAITSFAEYFSVQTQINNNQVQREIVSLASGVVEEFEEVDTFTNDYGQIVIAINAKLSKDSAQIIRLFDIDPDLASMNVNGSFYATENAKWKFNQSSERKFLKHLLEKIKIIGKNSSFVEPRIRSQPTPESIGKGNILRSRFPVDYYATKNMETVFKAVQKTLRSLSVRKEEYLTISSRQIYEVELCTDAMLFGDNYEKQKKKKRRRNNIPDCEYETFYLRNQNSILDLQGIEDYVRSEIKDWWVIRKYNDQSCKKIPHSRFDELKHPGIKRIDSEKNLGICVNSAAKNSLEKQDWNKEYLWPKLQNKNGSNTESFSNNLTFNTCNVAYKGKERIFFPISRQCRVQTPTCAIPYRNNYGNKNNIAYGLNLPRGGELLARKHITDNVKETDYARIIKYQVVRNKQCN
jgi:hypothetical protein